MSAAAAANDDTDLEALFDSIVASAAAPAAPLARVPQPAAHPAGKCPADAVFNQIGHMTRKLHDTLRELGYDKLIEKAAASIPDARDRLTYVAQMTQKAAERALTATETARPLQDKLEAGAIALSAQWREVFDGKLGVDEFEKLATATRAYLDELPQTTRATNEQLTEIMMAQDFQDLTGQVIKKVTELVQNMEQELVKVLVQSSPADKLPAQAASLINGPVVNGANRTDLVTSQKQVDELLESMGF